MTPWTIVHQARLSMGSNLCPLLWEHRVLITAPSGKFMITFSSVQFSSVAHSCPTFCDPMDYSTTDFPVHLQFLELTQTHLHLVIDAIQPSHPLLSPSPPAFSLPQHQGLFQWVSSSHPMAKNWSFSFSISASNEYLGLISFRSD